MRMSQIGIKRWKNKYLLLSILFLFVLLVISFLVNGEILKVLFSDAYESFADKKMIIDQELCWEFLLFDGVYYLGNVFPIFAIIVVFPFWEEINSFFIMTANRLNNRRMSIAKSIVSYGTMGGLAISLGFFLFFCAGYYFCIPTLNVLSGFESIFNYQLYHDHPFLFLCFMDFSIYFLVGFLFAVMSCGVMLLTNNRITAIIFPLFVFIVGSFVGNSLGIRLLQFSSCITVFCSDYTTGQCFVPLITVAIIDLIIILIGIRKNEKIIV